jgi:PTS system mannose-specific IIB component
MPVKHIRIDDRLIHGQVTVAWLGAVDVNHLIVANDEVARDQLWRTLLRAAAPGVRTSVWSIADTVAHCRAETTPWTTPTIGTAPIVGTGTGAGPITGTAPTAGAGEAIMIVARYPSDALRLLESGVSCPDVNVGNQAPRRGTDATMITRSISVTADDVRIYGRIAALAGSLRASMMPTDRASDFVHLLAKKQMHVDRITRR